jgi:hypothetical protein
MLRLAQRPNRDRDRVEAARAWKPFPAIPGRDYSLSQGMKNPAPRAQMLDGFNEGWIEFENGEHGAMSAYSLPEPTIGYARAAMLAVAFRAAAPNRRLHPVI